MLLEKYSLNDIERAINDNKYNPCPKYEDRDFWESLPDEIKSFYKDSVKKYINYKWEVIPVSTFLKFETEGDRSSFENEYNKRRHALGTLFLAELVEGKGNYISQIIDCIWCICEETGWQLSAHNWKRPDDPVRVLPDVEDCIIDLGAGDTAAMLAWIYYLLGDKLAEISPMITRRMEYELTRRIMIPYLESTEYWWMSYDPKLHVNNWNPWMNANCITVFLMVCKDNKKIASALYKAIGCIDKYIDRYSDDGACDEGATYWFQGPALLYTDLDILKKATGGLIDVGNEPKICEMAKYIYNANLYENKFVNFADGAATFEPNYSMIYRFGEYTHNEQLKKYSRAGFIHSITEAVIYQLSRIIPALCMTKEISDNKEAEVNRMYPEKVWYENMQVLITHQNTDGMGFALAAKGGSNAENHNHNDVGNFVLMHNGKWVFIDAGVGVYTKQTFGAGRYKIWTMQSDYHNLPRIGEYSQPSGKMFAAKNVLIDETEEHICMKMDISDAYQKESGIKVYERTLKVGKSKEYGFSLSDVYSLEKEQEVILNLMTSEAPVVEENIIYMGEVKAVISKGTQIKTEEIYIQDEKLYKVWGEKLYRILLINKTSVSGKFEMEVISK